MKKLIIMLILGLVLVGCGSKEEDKKEEVDAVSSPSSYQGADVAKMADSYDVIIIGAGGGGMSAAIAAKEAGANVVVFEKMPIIGGNTLKASAGMNASETKFQEDAGITDSNDTFYDETFAGGKETNNPELLRYMVDNSASAIEWLDSMGITLNNITITGGMSVERTHRPEDGSAVGQYLVSGLLRNVQERDIPIYLQTEVVEIIKENDEITGVKVIINQKEERTIKAKAVIVATGGFGANSEMVVEYQPSLEGFVTTNQEGSTGDGIVMVQQVGGAVVDMDAIQIHPTVEQSTSYLVTEAVRGEGAILVSQSGVRFYDELSTRDKVSQAIIELDEQYAYLVFDQGVRDRVKAINTYVESGFVLEGATIADLAKEMGVDPTVLEETMNVWGQAVESNSDAEFGRTTAMNDIFTGPFYAIKIAPGVHHTMGGVVINTDAQVLNDSNTPITGLYASGEVAGGIHGANRIGGNAVADIIIFGRQAGTQAGAFIKGN